MTAKQAAAVLAVAALCCAGSYWGTGETRTCTVTEKDRTYGKDGNRAGVVVYTEQCGDLAVQDVPWRWQWNSDEIEAALERGRTYEISTFDLPFVSDTPVITEVR